MQWARGENYIAPSGWAGHQIDDVQRCLLTIGVRGNSDGGIGWTWPEPKDTWQGRAVSGYAVCPWKALATAFFCDRSFLGMARHSRACTRASARACAKHDDHNRDALSVTWRRAWQRGGQVPGDLCHEASMREDQWGNVGQHHVARWWLASSSSSTGETQTLRPFGFPQAHHQSSVLDVIFSPSLSIYWMSHRSVSEEREHGAVGAIQGNHTRRCERPSSGLVRTSLQEFKHL
jgi:hypothetical protein